MAKAFQPTLTFLVYPCEESAGRFVAHCLEMDVLAVEDSKPKAILLLKELIADLIEAAKADGTLDEIYRPAPTEYWQMLARARPYRPTPRVVRERIKSPMVKRVDYALAV